MKLRDLMEKDAPLMLEWMKDDRVNKFFRFNPDEISLESTIEYIQKSKNDPFSYHLAIVDDNDEYFGTISLKNIDSNAKNGEYAIALRSKAQGHGAGRFATEEILRFAFDKLNLERVYLNVLSDNIHAIGFYKKIGFVFEGEFHKHVIIKDELKNIMWFRMMRCEYETRI